jgi:GYD domain
MGCNFKVLSQYATLGAWDFVTIVEAPDNETAAHLAIDFGSRGTVNIQTLPALSLVDLRKVMKGPKQMGKKNSSCVRRRAVRTGISAITAAAGGPVRAGVASGNAALRGHPVPAHKPAADFSRASSLGWRNCSCRPMPCGWSSTLPNAPDHLVGDGDVVERNAK